MSEKKLTIIQLHAIFESGNTANPLDEIMELTLQLCPEVDRRVLEKTHWDVTAIFLGRYPGFNENVSQYHNLRHTYSVVLASIRLFHGLLHEQVTVSSDFILQGLIGAYFHDVGMLPQANLETKKNTGHTKHHESRSIAILSSYLQKNKLPKDYWKNCAAIIYYTNLGWDEKPGNITHSALELCGQVVGTADLLAQMSDRYYLESLPLLFQEHSDTGIDHYSSALELMQGTIEFHEKVVKKRLEETLGNLAPAMQTHFHKRWNIDRNLYLDNINLNLEYLRMITHNCALDLSCWGKYLRRNPPVMP